jgi:NAD(P) transhydrogenase subunit alpha
MVDFIYIYVFMLAAFTGYEVISRVPVILHTPLMSGSNFVHGVVLVGAMVALGSADAAGGFVVTERMLAMFKPGAKKEAAK